MIAYRGFQQSSPFFCRQIGEDLRLTDSQEFQDFVRDRTQAEIIQAIGRLRADNRPQEQLCFYFCADYDLSFLEMKVENINAGDITIEAASLDEKSWWKIQNAVKELWSQGRNITQASVESISGITRAKRREVEMREIGRCTFLSAAYGLLVEDVAS